MRDTPNTTALLIEYGFIDNPKDQVKLQNNIQEGNLVAVTGNLGSPAAGLDLLKILSGEEI